MNTIVFMFHFGKMLRCEAQRAQNMKKKWRLIKRIREIRQRTKTGSPSRTMNLMAMARQNTNNPKLAHYIKKGSKNDCPDLIKEYSDNFLLEMETH